MEKYWALDLAFVKAKGKYVRTEHMLTGYFERHFTYKNLSAYKLNNYIRSEVISRTTEWDFLSESGEPYEYLKVIKRFIIPSKVIISKRSYKYDCTHRNEVLEKTKVEYSIRYVVDEDEMILKPSEIIYYREEVKRPYVYFFADSLRKVNNKILVLYDNKMEKYEYYRKYTDEEGPHRIHLSGTRAKEEIESICMNLIYSITPVENVEEVMI